MNLLVLASSQACTSPCVGAVRIEVPAFRPIGANPDRRTSSCGTRMCSPSTLLTRRERGQHRLEMEHNWPSRSGQITSFPSFGRSPRPTFRPFRHSHAQNSPSRPLVGRLQGSALKKRSHLVLWAPPLGTSQQSVPRQSRMEHRWYAKPGNVRRERRRRVNSERGITRASVPGNCNESISARSAPGRTHGCPASP